MPSQVSGKVAQKFYFNDNVHDPKPAFIPATDLHSLYNDLAGFILTKCIGRLPI